jgi:hypothetical protein
MKGGEERERQNSFYGKFKLNKKRGEKYEK